jgi:hypothetical protein
LEICRLKIIRGSKIRRGWWTPQNSHVSRVDLCFAYHHRHSEVVIGDRDLPPHQKEQRGPAGSLKSEKEDEVPNKNTCEVGTPEGPWFTKSLEISDIYIMACLLSSEAPLRKPKD